MNFVLGMPLTVVAEQEGITEHEAEETVRSAIARSNNHFAQEAAWHHEPTTEGTGR